jgi:hypothetical protein
MENLRKRIRQNQMFGNESVPLEDHWLVLIDCGKFLEKPPATFIQAMGLGRASYDFQKAAWALFKLRRRRITNLEVRQFLITGM